FTVEKTSAGGTTSTELRLLDDAGRVGELSRMLAGMEGSGLAQAHAEELLAAATAAQNGRDPGPATTAEPAARGGESPCGSAPPPPCRSRPGCAGRCGSTSAPRTWSSG